MVHQGAKTGISGFFDPWEEGREKGKGGREGREGEKEGKEREKKNEIMRD